MNPQRVPSNTGGRGGSRGGHPGGRGASNVVSRSGNAEVQPNLEGVATGNRRRRVDPENGDRYCTTCGQVIHGQARELISRCPYRDCGALQPYMERLWQFQNNGWGRCAGRNCATFIELTMLYCSQCGHLNAMAFERRERQERARRQQEDVRLRARIKELEENQARIDAENRDMRQVIQAQENDLFLARELPANVEAMLMDDEQEQAPEGNQQSGNVVAQD